MTLLADMIYDKMFGFFYSIYDYFQPQQKFYCYSFGGVTHQSTYYNSEPYKEIVRLIYKSNNITENPDEMDMYSTKAEFKNFYFEEKCIGYLSKHYLYPYYMRGASGLIVCITCGQHEDIEMTLNTKHNISLNDIFKLSKKDDSARLPSNIHLMYDFGIPDKKENLRPILVVIYSVESNDLIEKIKAIVEQNIESTGYEKQNTMIVVHKEEESNLYEGFEWLFTKVI